jgi:uncharacterized repeat protein (TIGR03803 family)
MEIHENPQLADADTLRREIKGYVNHKAEVGQFTANSKAKRLAVLLKWSEYMDGCRLELARLVKGIGPPLCRRKTEGRIGKRLANTWRRRRIAKKAHAVRGQEPNGKSLMKTGKLRPRRPCQELLTLAALALLLVGATHAQPPVFQTIHSFGQSGPSTGMILGAGGNFYGTIGSGGTNGLGAIYQFNANGGTLSTLYSFIGGSDGANPSALIRRNSDGVLFGTTSGGGIHGYGTVFEYNPNTQIFTPLYSFSNGANMEDGANPQAGLTLDSTGLVLYGATSGGGTNDAGTIFEFNLNNSTLSTLYAFGRLTNSVGDALDGAGPQASLTLDSTRGVLYGTTASGGTYGYGTLFQVNLNTLNNNPLTTLYAFSAGLNTDPNHQPDGYYPEAGLALDSVGGNLYGTTSLGGGGGHGTVFQFNLASGILTNLYAFTGGTDDGGYPQGTVVLGNGSLYGVTDGGGSNYYGTVFELATAVGPPVWAYSFIEGTQGGYPQAGLTLANGNLYGTTAEGGANSLGTIFEIAANGAPLTPLYQFVGLNDGRVPQANLMLASDGFLYGTTSSGGTSNNGVIFKVSPNGSGYQVAHNLLPLEGSDPNALMQASDTNLYGTTQSGGAGYGGIFQFIINPGASQYKLTPLLSFIGFGDDGYDPLSGLIQATDGNLYGTTRSGGLGGDGTLFYFNPAAASAPPITITPYYVPSPSAFPVGMMQASDGNLYGATALGDGAIFYFQPGTGAGPTNLHVFSGAPSDGSKPSAGLAETGDGWLYGTTSGGGSNGWGSIFRVLPLTAGSTPPYPDQLLYSFTEGGDGANPQAGLVAYNGALYGTTTYGASQFGTVFEYIPPTGSFAGLLITIHQFNGADGHSPNGLFVANGNLYGTTQYGGGSGNGTVFKINTATDLGSVTMSSGNLLFNLSTANYYSYLIQQTASLSPPDWVTTPTNPTLPANPIIGDGTEKQISLPTTGPELFFRVVITLTP